MGAQASLIAQTNAASKYIKQTYPDGAVAAIYVELEGATSRRRQKRTEILRAIEHVKMLPDSRLIIAKVDRLSRDSEFTAMLYNQQVPFTCCDNPNANEFTIKLLTLVAEKEAKDIRERIIAALQVKKDQGVPLGCKAHKKAGSKISRKSQLAGATSMREKWSEEKANVMGSAMAKSLHTQGKNLSQICEIMNKAGFQSPSGRIVRPQTISRWLKNNQG